jgi:ABC-type dipeptide/oligopeptide/nickel transport system ATPase component
MSSGKLADRRPRRRNAVFERPQVEVIAPARDPRIAVALVIPHDIAVVRYLVDEIAVMLDGRIVEISPVDDVLRAPTHEYTRRLIGSIPSPYPTSR